MLIVLDRFHRGPVGTDCRATDPLSDPQRRDPQRFWGGNLPGLVEKLPYLKELGIGAIWTTPLFEQVRGLASGGGPPRAPYHGYWTRDFQRIEPRWLAHPQRNRVFAGECGELERLIEAVHAEGMRLVLDFVCNHSSPRTSDGKGRLFDDGELVADFDDDPDHWYLHYGPITDWKDSWQLQHGDLEGLATFNPDHHPWRDYIRRAAMRWLGIGLDALRVDTAKHMPLWFWQEFCGDLDRCFPRVFRFGEWIHAHPDDEASVEFANRSGMAMLDYGLANAIRDCFAEDGRPESPHDRLGFVRVKQILQCDGRYECASELITFIENHDLPRLQSLGVDGRGLELAVILLLTSRGIPCLYYGCEQYLHCDRNGGTDPWNRPMMATWERTPLFDIISTLAHERRGNDAVAFGGQFIEYLSRDCLIFLRRYRDSRLLVLLNKGPKRRLELEGLDFPDGRHTCLLSGESCEVRGGRLSVSLAQQGAMVLSRRGPPAGDRCVRIEVAGVETRPGETLALSGSCPEFGEWDLRRAIALEPLNARAWIGEIPLQDSFEQEVGYKLVILPARDGEAPRRENRVVRQRLLPRSGFAKWRDHWGR